VLYTLSSGVQSGDPAENEFGAF